MSEVVSSIPIFFLIIPFTGEYYSDRLIEDICKKRHFHIPPQVVLMDWGVTSKKRALVTIIPDDGHI